MTLPLLYNLSVQTGMSRGMIPELTDRMRMAQPAQILKMLQADLRN